MHDHGTTRLRAWRELDVPFFVGLRNDVAIQSQLLAKVRGSDEKQVQRWLCDRTSAPGRIFFVIADADTDAAIGFVQVIDIDAIHRRGELGIAVARNSQRRGHGSRALQLLLAHVRDRLGLHKITLRVRADNLSAIRTYEQAGFKKCGRHRSHAFIEGTWCDVILMEKLL